jgi:uncharacterized membrane protein YgdD (TMEM256/DUF423 family)
MRIPQYGSRFSCWTRILGGIMLVVGWTIMAIAASTRGLAQDHR